MAKLVEDKQSGKISGRTELTMDLVSIRVRGRMVDLNTQEVTTSSESRTGKSAKVIGGAAAVGAVLGGIFGGGKGAAIGATSGAGAGGAVQVLTKGAAGEDTGGNATQLHAAERRQNMTATQVRVLIFEDLQCSDCAALQRMLDETLLDRYSTGVEFTHCDFPLEKHAWARKAAIAARYFTELDARLGIAYRRHALADLTADDFDLRLTDFARAHSLDGRQALAALVDPRLARLVDSDAKAGLAKGVTRTPTVFIDDQPFVEKFTVEEISHAIDQALAGE